MVVIVVWCQWTVLGELGFVCYFVGQVPGHCMLLIVGR